MRANHTAQFLEGAGQIAVLIAVAGFVFLLLTRISAL
jgi:hypothetical protein